MQISETPLDIAGIVFGMVGGLGLFLYGMRKMSDGLQAVAGDSMRVLLSRLTTNRFIAALTGAGVTAVLQSSSITTVLVVGFVGAGLMTLPQTVGIIMGANVGTTITAQMLAFDISNISWLLVGLGFASWSAGRRDVTRNVGTMLMGFGLLFIGMGQMGEATRPLREFPPFIDLMASMNHVALAILIGAAFTALVQSSSATIGIVIMLAAQGHITLDAGIALAIGATIGTCVTALLAGIGKTPQARRVGVVHVLHNSIGALMWLPFIDHLEWMAEAVSPSYPELEGIEKLSEEVPRQVANAITIYASANLAVLIWFAGPIARLATWLIKDSPRKEPDPARSRYLDPVFLQTPTLAIEQIEQETWHLGTRVRMMLDEIPHAVIRGTRQELDHIEALDDEVDLLHEEILSYATLLSRDELNSADFRKLESRIEIINNLEAIGDLIETNIVVQSRRRLEMNFTFTETGEKAVHALHREVSRGLEDVLEALLADDDELAREVNSRKSKVEGMVGEANDTLTRELFRTGSSHVAQFRIESDLIDQISRLFYRVRRIAKAVAGSSR